MVVFNKVTFSKINSKYFIWYENDDEKVMLFLLKMIAYRRDFDETKYVSFLIKDIKLLQKIK